MKKTKNVGWVFIIEGFAGSGKSSLSKKILNPINKKIGKTILIDGDDLRNFFKSINKKFGYSKSERSKSAIPTAEIIKLISKNNLNVIYPCVGYNKFATKLWYQSFENLVYIQIRSDINKIIKFGKKKLYKNTKKNVVGVDIKPYFNNKADIIIENNFDKPISKIATLIMKNINKLI